tara:strand:- start:852 stop:1367 length:516 start_codon:yes stop_codon:yes gene_type:complete
MKLNILKGKISYLFIFIAFFTVIYTILDDKHFRGENKVQDIVKDEVIKQKVDKTANVAFTVREKFIDVENPMLLFGGKYGDDKDQAQDRADKIEADWAIKKTTEDTKDDLEEVELQAGAIKPDIFQRFYNRLYFSVITGCLIGYGDISPVTNLCKFITMIQSLSTIALIIY